MSRATQRGFTLLEILVALVVLGFLMASLSQGVRFGLQSWEVQTRQIAVGGDMDAIDRALRRLIEQADPGDVTQEATFSGGAHTMAFLSRLPLAATDGTTRDAKIGLGVDGASRLVLRSSAQPHAEFLTGRPPSAETVLLDHVDHVDFAYWRGTGKQPGWLTSWGDAEMPGLVRIHVAFRKGDRRHFADLIAAPMLTRRQE